MRPSRIRPCGSCGQRRSKSGEPPAYAATGLRAASWQARRQEPRADTVDRLLTDLRAALNVAGLKHRRELPASFALEVRLGTKALGMPTEARRQILTDEQVRAVVDAAFEVDESGDFGRLVLLAAASGRGFRSWRGQLSPIFKCSTAG